jgi:quercetin dioxygenase-like cupin family protein
MHPGTAPERGEPVRPLTTPMSFDCRAEIARMKTTDAWQRGDHTAHTLINAAGFHLLLMALKAGGHIKEHRAEGDVSIETIEGHIRAHVQGQTVDLPTGGLLMLPPGVVHDVEAMEESAFLLTIATPPSTVPGG